MTTLTPAMRDWLGSRQSERPFFYDFVLGFQQKFNLTPQQAGDLLAAWILETV